MEDRWMKQHLREMSILNRIGRMLNKVTDREQVLQIAVDAVVELLCPDIVMFFIKEGDILTLQACSESGFNSDIFPVHTVGECLCGLAVSQAKPVYSINIHIDIHCTRQECKKSGITSFAALPLINDSEIIGVMSIASKVTCDFEKQSDFLEILASAISTVLTNTILFRKLSDYADSLEQKVEERNQMKEIIQRKEEQIRGITDNIPGIVYQFYADSNNNMGLYYVNERSEEITGLKNTPLDNYFQRFTGCVFPEYRELFLSSIKEAIAEKKKWIFESKFRKPSGEDMWFRGISHPKQTGNEIIFNGLILDITEQKLAEEALKKGEERYFSLLEYAPFGVHHYELQSDGQLIFLGANHSASRILGIDHSSFTGNTIEKAFPILVNTKIPDAYRHVASEGTVFTDRVIYRDEMGITGAFDVNAFQTGPNRMAALFLDVTEKTKAEMALKDSEARFRNIMEQITDVIYMTDLKGRITYISPGAEPMFGYSITDMTGNLLSDYLPDFEKKRVLDLFKDSIETGQTVTGCDLKFIHKRGNLFDGELSIAIVRSGDAITGTAGVIRDVTERKRTNDLLRMNEARLSTLLELSRMTGAEEKTLTDFTLEKAIELTRSKIGYLAFMNNEETVLTMYSWSRNAMAQCFIEDKPIEYPVELTGLWGEAVRQRKPVITNNYTAETRWKKGYPPGHVPVIRHMNIPVFDGNRIVLVAGLGNKEEPYEEEDVRQLTLMMDGMWKIIKASRAEKSLRESEEQLRQSQKMESIGRLAGGVAHDFNNLLTPILCYGELLKFTIHPDDERSEQVTMIIDAAKRARELTRQLLAFSRRQALQIKSVDLCSIVTGMKKLLQRTIRENIRLEVNLPFSVCPVMADTGQVEQILMNLSVNAQDAMPEGGILAIKVSQIELDKAACSGRPEIKPGLYGMLAVSDTGCGMDEETQKRIFEPFFSTKGEAGTGLGLATVYGIVKQHSGNIWLYSEPGHGTTFKIFLPVSETYISASEQIDKKSVTGGIETLLIVEDDRVVRNIVHQVLLQNGYNVIVTSNGEEALKIAEDYKDQIDLLLTDVIMPGINGKELYMHIRDIHPESSVMYMSGYTDNIINVRNILPEDENFIEKPFSVEEFTTMVRRVLDRRKK